MRPLFGGLARALTLIKSAIDSVLCQRLSHLCCHPPRMLIPIEELKLLYEGVIGNITDRPPRLIPSVERYQGARVHDVAD